MINDTSINAFGDELTKIAGLLGDIGRTAKKWVSTGWNKPSGLYEKARHLEGPMKGKAVMDTAGKQVWKERPKATWMGRGNNSVEGEAALPWSQRKGVTKYLPVGDKGITAGVTAAMIPAAISKEDPQGMQRTQGERVSGLVGSTVGGLAGMGAMAHLPSNPLSWARGAKAIPMRGLGITRSIIGGIGGSIIGERMATAPNRALRRVQMPTQELQDPAVSGGVA